MNNEHIKTAALIENIHDCACTFSHLKIAHAAYGNMTIFVGVSARVYRYRERICVVTLIIT